MEEMGYRHMQFRLSTEVVKTRIHAYRPYKWIKFTFKTSTNPNVIAKIKLAEMAEMLENEDMGLGEVIDEGLSDLDASDYMSLVAYDVRAKIYLNSHTNLLLRCFVTGIQSNNYSYMGGFTYKF